MNEQDVMNITFSAWMLVRSSTINNSMIENLFFTPANFNYRGAVANVCMRIQIGRNLKQDKMKPINEALGSTADEDVEDNRFDYNLWKKLDGTADYDEEDDEATAEAKTD